METVQIEITNACHNSCSNCTRLCGHHKKPYFMQLNKVKQAIDSMKLFPNMVGIMGGEPLLHPQFEEICKYLQTVIPRERCGLWTTLPKGKEHYREIIVETFGNILINDHTRDDIVHAPILVASDELPLQSWQKDYLINKCWVQETWSASINEKGAWFCEVAAALATLLEVDGLGWSVSDCWWTRSPQHYNAQMAMCHYCGCAMPLKKRVSTEEIDDISPKMFEVLKNFSPKIKQGKYEIHNLEVGVCDDREVATYKDESYRDEIAKRYGLFLVVNDYGYHEPHLEKNFEVRKEVSTDGKKD